ncbi:MAG: hypothetical protein GEU86_12100, partial [Actinophytocola sp.]|nr:hypothetical protein [Actinophytocola sp.]
MTTFVQAGSAAGILFLPRDVVGPVPVKDGPFRDMEVLSLPGWQIAELDDANDLLDIVRAARRRRAATDAIEYQAIARLAQLRAAEGEERARYVPDEVALELRVGTGNAANRVTTATALVHRMPLTL